MPNIETKPTVRKGNGEEKGNPTRRSKKLIIQNCFKNPTGTCDNCTIPVEKCHGNFKNGRAF